MKNIKISMLALAALIAGQAVAGEIVSAPQTPVTVVGANAATEAGKTVTNVAKPGYLASLKSVVVSGATAVSNAATSAYTTVGSYMPASKWGKFGVAVAAVAAVGGVYSYRKEIKNFVKKHWGKILAGAGIATAAILAYKYGYIKLPAFPAGKATATTATTIAASAAVEAAQKTAEVATTTATAANAAADVAKNTAIVVPAVVDVAKDATDVVPATPAALDTVVKALINIKDYTVKTADVALDAVSNGMNKVVDNPTVNN